MMTASDPRIENEVVAHQLDICEKIKQINREKYKDGAPGYYIQTFGCQQNEADSERIAGLCTLMGYVPAESAEAAKLIL